ncbi:uncharacterized protein LOC118415695 [Branchiostoma floridae]|uniref:Uncharacterized protein LOC118415695 n=1 Tax=Branchiostoma floridae TaxID=7739 RepID=A0A9J7L5B1_BRAFL|nr:uncharacterized protein LOC118415695 [Branchiostoma floridae]
MITSTDSCENGAYAVPPVGDTGNIPNIQQNNLYLNPIQNAIRDHNTMYAQRTLESDQNHGQNTSSYNPLYLPSDESANPTFVSNPQPKSRLLETSEPQIFETSSVTVGETAEAVTVVSAPATGNEDLKDDTAQGRPGTGNEESASSRQADIDDSIQPYAVRYHDDDMLTSSASQNGETDVVTSDDVDIQPYAVAYMGQDDVASSEETRTKDASHHPCSHKRAAASNSSPVGTEDSADSKNDLITNQMYQPGQPAASFGSRYRRTCLAVFMTTLVVSSILGGILSVVLNLTIPESTTILPTNDSSLVATPTLPSALTSSQGNFLQLLETLP